jgi:hypothetical protein
VTGVPSVRAKVVFVGIRYKALGVQASWVYTTVLTALGLCDVRRTSQQALKARTPSPFHGSKHSTLVLAKGCEPDRAQVYNRTHIFRVFLRICSKYDVSLVIADCEVLIICPPYAV